VPERGLSGRDFGNRVSDGMHNMRPRQVQFITGILGRALWLALFVAHGRALIAAWRYCQTNGFTLEAVGGCILLTVAIAVFALKLCGAPWLRFCRSRRSIVAACLILAIIHLDCLDPGLRSTFVSKCVVVVATAPLVVAVPRLARALRSGRVREGASHKFHLPDARSHEEAWLDAFRPHCLVLASHLYRLRAPPA
jgi:hypothetical protein